MTMRFNLTKGNFLPLTQCAKTLQGQLSPIHFTIAIKLSKIIFPRS
ncbi:MAG: hypothetical protein ACTS45_01345 [Candidatus Hodgkinia cicadicola]